MAAEAILAEIQALSLDERIELVQIVWDQIAAEASKLPVTPAQRRILDERIARNDGAPDDVVLWSDVRDEMLCNR